MMRRLSETEFDVTRLNLTSIAVLLSILAVDRSAPAANSRPNIVYILADDLGYGDVSCFNPDSRIKTPNIDQLARQGMRFTDAHSNSSVCTPTRYGIMTGRYAWRSKLKRGVLGGYSPPLIESGRLTVAQFLHDQGYATACTGKWHLGLAWQLKAGASGNPSEKSIDFSKAVTSGPNTEGFEYSFIIPASLDMAPYLYLENGLGMELPTNHVPDSPRPALYRAGPIAPHFKFETCLPEIVRHATAWIDESKKTRPDRPFFLYVPLTSPHTPHVPLPEFQGKSGAGNYGDFVLETDWAVGQILQALRRDGLEDSTLAILTSDNGAHSEPLHLEEQYGHRANYIFRGQKSDAWDGGHHIPFVARWPGNVPPGTSSDQTICLTDLFATCVDLLKQPRPKGAAQDSFSILPLLEGKTNVAVRPGVVMHSNDGYFAVKQGPWKLVLCRGSGGWTLPENQAPPSLPELQLYNVQDDPSEKENLYAEHPDIVAKLKAALDDYRRESHTAPQ
jgi:arylsulfatase A-like enzyme